MSRIVDGNVSIMPIALPADARNDAVGASVATVGQRRVIAPV
jgi:hypothetical protein